MSLLIYKFLKWFGHKIFIFILILGVLLIGAWLKNELNEMSVSTHDIQKNSGIIETLNIEREQAEAELKTLSPVVKNLIDDFNDKSQLFELEKPPVFEFVTPKPG